MSTIEENLNKLQSTKSAIKSALISCGENPSDTFSEYPSLIHNGDMSFCKMFGCKTAEESAAMPSAITISSAFTSTNLVDMSYMFFNEEKATSACTIESITFPSNFDTRKVKTFQSFIYRNPKIKSFDLSMFKGNSATNTKWMLGVLKNIESIDLSNFTIPNCIETQGMFFQDSNLKEIKGIENLLSGNTNITNVAFMFDSCSSLETLDLSKWDFRNVTRLSCMFYYCNKLADLKLPKNFCTNKNTSLYFTFDSVPLPELDVSEWDVSNVTDMQACFRGNQGILTGLDKWNMANCSVIDQLFEYNPPRNFIGQIENWNVGANYTPTSDDDGISMYGTFRYVCHVGDTDYDLLDLSKWDTSKVNDFMYFIRQYPSETANHIKKIDISSFDLSNCYRISYFCEYCQSIIIFGEGFGKWKKEYSSGSMTLDLTKTGVRDSSGNFTTQEETLNSLLNLYDRATDSLNIGGGSALPTMTIKLSSTTSVSDEWKDTMTNKGYTITVG